MQNSAMPHWAATNASSTYRSQKALGLIYDHVEEKLQRVLATPDTQGSQANTHIMALVKKAQESNAAHVHDLRKRMESALATYDSEMSKLAQRLKKTMLKEEDKKKLVYDWKASHYRAQQAELIENEEGKDGKDLAAAILYEADLRRSKAKSFNGDVKVRQRDLCTRALAETLD